MFQSYSNLKQIINSANQSQICNGPTRWGSVASMWGMSWRNNGRTGYGLYQISIEPNSMAGPLFPEKHRP